MNAAAILALIGDLYAQVAASHARISELEEALADQSSPGKRQHAPPANDADKMTEGRAHGSGT